MTFGKILKLNNIKHLRYFEAVARLGSFAAAARELCVTPAAVSQQIRNFEQNYNFNLFVRLPNSLILTNKARSLLADVSSALTTVDTIVGNIRNDELNGKLVINCAPSLGLQWLTPRIEDFIRKYPLVQLTIFSDEFPSYQAIEKFDLRIVHGAGEYGDLNSELLMTDKVFPVLSPALQAVQPIHHFADLTKHTLLHDICVQPSEASLKWKRWFESEGDNATTPKKHINFGNANLMLDAARRGLGVALGRSNLVQQDLISGTLIAPINVQKIAEHAYYTVTTHLMAQSPRVTAFRTWLQEQVQQCACHSNSPANRNNNT